ncbi:C39 family peptidase [Amycolatopsis samaneae]|uniref:C39 family peptidase n=1 Tax=Amycolatopsis samaneae TaxID=664691 RepID=A0ABW5G8L5_9PSEU
MPTPSLVHRVPYFAQWESPELVTAIVTGEISAAADPAWASSGADSPEEYEFWGRRVCGMACLKMLLVHYGLGAHRTMDLAREVTEYGGYVRRADGVDGLIYAPFVRYVRERFGLSAESAPKLPVSAIHDAVGEGTLVMASVHQSIRDPGAVPPRTGGHLVLVVGTSGDGFVIHNPSGHSGRSQAFAEVREDDFRRFYAERGILVRRD